MVNHNEDMAPSPRQPLNGQGVLRIPGSRLIQTLTTGNVPGHSESDLRIKLGTINVATMRGKEEELVEVMKMRNLSVLALSETRMRGRGDRTIHENYRLLHSGEEDGKYGVGFLVSECLAPYVEQVNNVNERIICIDMKLDVGVSLMQVYAPQQGRPVIEKEQFYRLVQEAMDLMKYQSNIILCGDWNGHVGQGREGYERNIGAHSIGERNVEGQRLLDFVAANNIAVMNTYYQHRESHKWTWYRYNHQREEYTQRSMIDLFLTNNKGLFLDVKAVPSVSLDADHRLVIARVRIKKPKAKRRTGMKRYKLTKLKEPEKKQRLKEMIQSKSEEATEEDSLEVLWMKFKTNITETADEVLGQKKPYQGKKKMTPWWSAEVKEAVKVKMKKFRKWMKTRTAEDRLEYTMARNVAERVKKEAKEACWRQIGEDLENDLQGTKKLLYSLARGYRGGKGEGTYAIKDKQGNLLTQTDEIGERWKEYFYELLNAEQDPELTEEYNSGNIGAEELAENNREEAQITTDEVKDAIAKMKNRKSPGDDELPVEILRAGGECVIKQLHKMYNTAYITERIPSDWQKGVISPIYKKGEKTSCDNHRGITLLSHAGKIYSRILENRLRDCVENVLDDSQFGFRPGRGTTDATFIVKLLLEKSWEWGIDKYVLFIDLEKAFDRVDRGSLWQILQDPHYNIPTKLVRVIKSMYTQSTNKVMTQDIESDWFEIKSGVRQGDVLSPLLFVIFMDKCLRDIRTEHCREETVMYADDVVAIADSAVDIQDVASRWWNGMKANGMKINTKKGKTEYVVVSRTPELYDIYMEHNKINQTENYCHLGVNVGTENLQETEIGNRISKYNANVVMMYPILKDKHVPKECKIIVYKSILKPILLYGSEIWSLTTKTESRLQAAEMRVLRLIKGVTRRDKIRNTQIRQELNVLPLLEDIERNKLRWYGHVKRMGEEKKPRKYLEWRPQGKRPVGRPRKRWIEGVSSALERRGTSLAEVEESRRYENRGEWRSLLRGSPADR